MSAERKFRSAINGFNRQDVATYIEAASARAAATKAEKEKLQTRCTRLEAALDASERSAAEAAARCEELEAQLAALQDDFDSTRRELEDVRSEKELLASVSVSGEELLSMRKALEEAREKLARKEEELADCLAKAVEYDAVKDRVASLELSASRRAVEIERSAEEHAAQVLQNARQADAAAQQAREAAALHFRSQLGKLSRDSRFSASLLTKELSQLTESLGRLAAELDTAAGELDAPQPGISAPETEEN